MQPLTAILLAHARRYPKMEPRDAVKLLYQNEFGGGHLIADEAVCRSNLRSEYAATVQTGTTPLLEELGNGIARVNLAALDAYGYNVDALCDDFIRSASLHRGTMDSFLEKLALLRQLTEAAQMPFSSAALEEFLTIYAAEGYPPISHSGTYRENYHPAYRVVDRRCLPAKIQKHRIP